MNLPALPTFLKTTSLLASTSLLALSAVTVYLTKDYTTSLDYRVPPGPYTWVGLLGSSERGVYWAAVDSGSERFNQVELSYTTNNDIWILMSGCVGLVAGLVGWLAVWRTSRKEKSPKSSRQGYPWVLVSSIFFSAATLAMSLTSSIMTSQTKTRLQGSTCIPHTTYTSTNNYFVCTHELAACNLLENIYMEDMEWSERMCKEAEASRRMLIPTLLCALVLIVVSTAQVVLGKKRDTTIADTRVEKLQQDDDWETSTIYEPMRYETREKE